MATLTLIYKGPKGGSQGVQPGTIITVNTPTSGRNSLTPYDIENALKNMGLPHSEVQFARDTSYWETAEEREIRMSNSAAEQSYSEQSNIGSGGGSGFLAFAAGAAKGVGGGIKKGVNLVLEERQRQKLQEMEETSRDMQAKREYTEKHGQEIADKIKELQEKIKIIEKDNSLTARARLQGQLDCLAEEYLLEQSITMGDSNLQTLKDKYKTLINNTIKKIEIPKEEPELTEVLQYLVENARKTDKFLETDKEKKDNENKVENWISGAMYSRLEYLKALYPKHPVMKIYNSKLAKRKITMIVVGVGVVALFVLYFIFYA